MKNLASVLVMTEYLFCSSTGSSLSNFFYCDLKVWGHKFCSVEQAYQWFKACFHKSWVNADAILATQDSHAVYKLGRGIITTKLWHEQKVHVMLHLLKHKLAQCDQFKQELLENKDCIFVEFCGNRFWGRNVNHQGSNTLGVLMHMLICDWECNTSMYC